MSALDTDPDRRTVTCNAADTMAEHRACEGTWWRAGPGPNTGDCQCACHHQEDYPVRTAALARAEAQLAEIARDPNAYLAKIRRRGSTS